MPFLGSLISDFTMILTHDQVNDILIDFVIRYYKSRPTPATAGRTFPIISQNLKGRATYDGPFPKCLVPQIPIFDLGRCLPYEGMHLYYAIGTLKIVDPLFFTSKSNFDKYMKLTFSRSDVDPWQAVLDIFASVAIICHIGLILTEDYDTNAVLSHAERFLEDEVEPWVNKQPKGWTNLLDYTENSEKGKKSRTPMRSWLKMGVAAGIGLVIGSALFKRFS